MDALAGFADIELTVATEVPEWFLRSSCTVPFSLHRVRTDVGLVQKNPLEQDIPATIESLSGYYPVRPETLRSLTGIFSQCGVVVCDIAPAGILAAREAGVASVLVENFTWDWIYEGYSSSFPRLREFIQYLRQVNQLADYRVQTVPVCDPVVPDLVVPPVARAFRESRDKVRGRLGVGADRRLVLVSMGGIGVDQLPITRMLKADNCVFAITGYRGVTVQSPELIFLPPDSDVFHPDMVRACDAVIGKAGYSTLAETYHAGVPFGYVSRPGFRESGPLVSFIREEMRGMEITPQDFWDGRWVDTLPRLFQRREENPQRPNGAAQCARFLLSLRKRDEERKQG